MTNLGNLSIRASQASAMVCSALSHVVKLTLAASALLCTVNVSTVI